MANYQLNRLARGDFSTDREHLAKEAAFAGKVGDAPRGNLAERQIAAIDEAAQRAQKTVTQAQEAERKQADREAREANRSAESNMRGNAVAFFRDPSGRVRPITAPSGGTMRKWDTSGVLWDDKTGKPYSRDGEGKLQPVDLGNEGEIVKKGGHVYRVKKGMPWRWEGTDPDNLVPDKTITAALEAKSRSISEKSSASSALVRSLKSDIASDEKRIKEIEGKLLLSSEEERAKLKDESAELEKGLAVKRDREAQAELANYRAQAEKRDWADERLKIISGHLDEKAAQAFKFPNTARLPDLTTSEGQPDRETETLIPTGDLDISRYLRANSEQAVQIAESMAEQTRLSLPESTLVDNALSDTGLEEIGYGNLNTILKAPNADRQAELKSRLASKIKPILDADRDTLPVFKIKATPEFTKATGLTHIPDGWMTPEAAERQLTAKLAGQSEIKAPKGYKLEGGKLFAPKEESTRIFGVTLPWTRKTTDEEVGTLKFTEHGVPFLEVKNQISPSFSSKNYYRGLPEYVASPNSKAQERLKDLLLSSPPRKQTLSSDDESNFQKWYAKYASVTGNDKNPDADGHQYDYRGFWKENQGISVEKDMHLPDTWKLPGHETFSNESRYARGQYAQFAGKWEGDEFIPAIAPDKDWDARKWDSEKLRTTLDQWQMANDAERQDIISSLDARQAILPSGERRLDTAWLYESGQLSAQDARLFEKTAYGTEPGLPDMPATFDKWVANSDSPAASAMRNGVSGEAKTFWELLAGPGGRKLESIRLSALQRETAKREFLSDFYQQNARRVDFNVKAFTTARDAFLGATNPVEWAVNGLNTSLQSAAGSSAGMMAVQTPKLILDDIYTRVTGEGLLSENERELIGAQTYQALRNMKRAIADRMPNTFGEAWSMGHFATPEARQKLWSGEKGGALKAELTKLQAAIDSGKMTPEDLQAMASSIATRAAAFHADVDNGRMDYENFILDPRSAMSRNLAAYMQTLDPAYFQGVESAALNSAYEQEIMQRAGDYASMNGAISESSFLGPLQTSFIGAQTAPLTETGVELASNLLSFGVGKALTVGKWMAKSERLGLTLNRTGRALGKLEGIEEKFFELGKVSRPIGGKLTNLQKARNIGVDLAKQGWASGGGEAFEEVVSAFGQAGATFGDAAAQGLQGFIGGVGLGMVHGPVGAAVGTVQTKVMEAVRGRALSKFVENWNQRFPESPITLDQAKQAQNYQDKGTVQALNTRLAELVTRKVELAKQIAAEPEETTSEDSGGQYNPSPRLVALAEEQRTIEGEIAAVMSDVSGVFENSLAAVQEINGLTPAARNLVDAAVKVATGVELSPEQEQTLLERVNSDGRFGGFVAGNRIIISDKLREDIATIAPTTARLFLNKDEAAQIASAADDLTEVPEDSQRQGGQTVSRRAHNPENVGSTPTPATTSQATPAAGGRYAFDVTYLPKGSTRPVTATRKISASSPEQAASKRDAVVKGLSKLGEIQSVSELRGENDAPSDKAPTQPTIPENRAYIPPAEGAAMWKGQAVTEAVKNAAAAFGYKIVDTGIPLGIKDRWGNAVNLGTAWYDKMNPGSEIGQWIDGLAKSNPEAHAMIAEKASSIGVHRVWFGHDFATNLFAVKEKFGWLGVPDYIGQLLKDSLTKSGIPFPGVQLLVHSGVVSDRVATDWLSTNIGEVFGGGIAFFGTYRLALAAKKGHLTKPRVVFATVGVGIKLVAGVATAQPFLVLSGLADAAILVTSLDQVKAAFRKGQEVAKTAPAKESPAAVEAPADKSNEGQPTSPTPEPTPAPVSKIKRIINELEKADDLTPENQENWVEAPDGVPYFRTKKGSVYIINGQTTERTKAKGIKEGDEGKKEPSTITVYVSPEGGKDIAMFQGLAAKGRRITLNTEENTVQGTYPNERLKKRKNGTYLYRYSLTPEVGLVPVELWKADAEGYRAWHPGHPIIEIQNATNAKTTQTKAAKPTSKKKPAPKAAEPAPVTEPEPVGRTIRPGDEIDPSIMDGASLQGSRTVMEVLSQPVYHPDGRLKERGRVTGDKTPVPEPAESPFSGQMNGRKVILALSEVAPWMFSQKAIPFVLTPRIATNEAGTRLYTQDEAKAVPASDRGKLRKWSSAFGVHEGRILVDQAVLTKQLASLPEGERRAKLTAIVDEEIEHYATARVRNAEQLTEDWNMLPDAAKQRVIETYFTDALAAAGGDWRAVQVNPTHAALEFWRMYRQAMKSGATTEQIALLNDVATAARVSPEFGRRILDALRDIARWLREELPNVIDRATRERLEEGSKAIDAEIARLAEAIKDESTAPQQQAETPAPKPRANPKARSKDSPSPALKAGEPAPVVDDLEQALADFEKFLPAASKPTTLENVSLVAPAGAKAFHGTPHTIERFSLEKIGTGEGAQAYGWGLYFAERPSIAEWYRDKLTRSNVEVPITVSGVTQILDTDTKQWAAYILSEDRNRRDASNVFEGDAIDSIIESISAGGGIREDGSPTPKKESLEAIAWLNTLYGKPVEFPAIGNLYTVDLATDDGTLLDWDAPFEKQTPYVQERIRTAKRELPEWFHDELLEKANSELDELTGRELYLSLKRFASEDALPGDTSDGGNPDKEASEYLTRLGIPGLQYLDGPSRKTGGGTRNFVIFDESRIRITHVGGKPLQQPESVGGQTATAPAAAKATPEFVATAANLASVMWSRGYNTPEAFARFLVERFADRVSPKVLAQVWNLGENSDPDTAVNWSNVVAEIKRPTVEPAAAEAATHPRNDLPQPTEAQKVAGNYQKGHVKLSGLDISIENPEGSIRSGADSFGKPWSVEMKSHYGYVKRTEGKDGDHLDVFIKPGTPLDWNGPVFVINQTNEKGKFDEHKAVLGAADEKEARELYLANYAKGWKGLSSIAAMPFDAFKTWASEGDLTKEAVPVDGDASEPTFEQRREEMVREVDATNEITFGDESVRLVKSTINPDRYDLFHIKEGESKLISNRHSPGTLVSMRQSAVNAAIGLKVAKELGSKSNNTTQINLPPDIARGFVDFGASIPKSELYTSEKGYGLEDEPHVTVHYGLDTTPTEVAAAVSGIGPIEITFGKTSLFESENSPYDVLKVDVDGEGLRRLNALLRDKFPFADAFPDYKPHATIAYLKKGEGKKYVGSDKFEGKRVRITEFVFSDKQEKQTTVPLATPKSAALADLDHRIKESKATVKRMVASKLLTPEEAGKRSKADGMRFAAERRQITGELTPIERAAQQKRQAGNYIGKPVLVAGKAGMVAGNPFGRVKVRFDDGSEQIVAANEVLPLQLELPVGAKPMSDIDALRSELVLDNLGLAGSIAKDYGNIRNQSAEDITQEAKVGLIIAAEKFDPTRGVPFSGYAGRIIRNRLNDMFRRSKRSAETVEDTPLPSGDTRTELLAEAIAATAADSDLQAIRTMIANIPARPRRALEGYMAGDTWAEIGEREGISHEGARKRAMGAMSAMKAALQKMGVFQTDDVFPAREEFSLDRIPTVRIEETPDWAGSYISQEPTWSELETAPAASKAVALGIATQEEIDAAQAELWRVVRSADADALYDALPASRGGRFISSDIARNLSDEIRESSDAAMRLHEATIKPAGWYSVDRLRRELSDPAGREYFGILAGGYGAGKTKGLSVLENDEADLIFEASLRHQADAEKIIDSALQNGWSTVRVVHIMRPIELAAAGSILRAWEVGRWNNIHDLIKSHIDSQRTIVALAAKYAGDGRVKFTHILNDGTLENPKRAALVPLEEVASGGSLSYDGVSERAIEALADQVEADFYARATTDFQKQIVRLAGRGAGSQVRGRDSEGTQSGGSGPSTAPVGAKPLRTWKSPQAALEVERIEEEGRRARQYREDHKKAAVENNGIGAQEFWKTHLSGRLDKLEFYAPGAKAAVLDDRRQEALVAATINAMLDTMRQDIVQAFGYPKFWDKNRKRLQQFLDEILPAAARLEVSHVDDDGNFVFRDFQMRSGIIPFKKVNVMGLGPGDRFMEKGNLYTIGQKVEGKGFVLLRDMLAEDQQEIFEAFHEKFPESAHYLDRFIMPGMEEARYMGPQGTMTAEFNRHSLLSLFNEWPQELRELFGNMPLPDMPYVEGYTPDVAEQKTLVYIVTSLLRRFKSGARKFKAGEARESGNVKNLFEGFSVRALEAAREKIRVQTRQKLIEAAAIPEDRIQPSERAKYVPVDQTFSRLMEAVKIAQNLDPKAFPGLSNALNPQEQALMVRILGDAYRLRGRGLMIHKEVEKELMLGTARQITSNLLTRIFAGLLERFNSGLLATPYTAITNWASNEVVKVVRLANRFNFALISAITLDPRAAQLGAYEFGFLLRGFITDRFPQWQRDRIQAIVPRELFDDQTGLEAMDIDPNKSIFEELLRFNPGGAFLKAIQYGEIDIRQKQQLAYAAYRAHGAVAANEVPDRDYRDSDGNKISRHQWIRNWMQAAPAEVHRDVYLTTVLYMMDYQNVPAWIDASQSNSAIGQIVKRALIPFAKWPYNMARQLKRFSWDSAFDILPGKSPQQRREGAANLMVMGGMLGIGAWLVGANKGDDDDEKLIGTSVDSEGKLLEVAFRTGNRLNLSRLARIVFAHGLMRGVDFTITDGSGESKDLWWRYRNYPYFKEGILMGYAARGQWADFGTAFSDVSGDYMSLGLLAKILGLSSFDKDKPVPFRATEALYDVTTAGLMPSPWRQFAVKMADPIMRKTTPSASMGYEANAIDAIKVNTPGLSKSVPSVGERKSAAFAPFSADAWFKRESGAIEKNPDIPVAEKGKLIAAVQKQARKLALPALDQKELFRRAGLPVENMNLERSTTVPAASEIKQLNEMGVGPESYTYRERTDKNGVKYKEIIYPNPATVRTSSPGVESVRFFGGFNVMPVKRGAVRKAISAKEMFSKPSEE